MMVADFIPKCS